MSDPIVNRSAKFFISVAKPYIGIEEKEAVLRVLESNWISSGQICEQFEHEFANANGKKYGVTCASGTLALQLALMAAGHTGYQTVTVPTLTMIAVANSVLACKGYLSFVDSEKETGNGSYNAGGYHPFRIWSSLYGEIPKYPKLIYGEGLELIFDAAEAHYAKITDHYDFICYSFYANKIITTGEGGIVITDDLQAATRLKQLRAHAFTPGNHFHHQEYALGCRMTDLQAAIGLAQHRKKDWILAKRTAIANAYLKELKGLDWLEFPHRSEGSVWWVFPFLVKPNSPISRDELRFILAENGIETRTYFYPLHRQEHLKQFAIGEEFPVADDLSSRGLYCGIYPSLTDDEIAHTCKVIKESLRRSRCAR